MLLGLLVLLVLLVLFVLTGLTGCDENVSGDIASSADETEIYTQTDDETKNKPDNSENSGNITN